MKKARLRGPFDIVVSRNQLVAMHILHPANVYTHVIDGFFGIWAMEKQYFTAFKLNFVLVERNLLS